MLVTCPECATLNNKLVNGKWCWKCGSAWSSSGSYRGP